jgi:hypothetical protein
MHSINRTALVAAMTFVAGMAGLMTQWALPAQYLTDSRRAIGSVVGLVTLLLALVLGLLIWASYGVFATQQSEAQALGPSVLQLDFSFEQYGPEATPGRVLLKEETLRARDRFFGGADHIPKAFTYAQSRADMLAMSGFFGALAPATDAQRELLGTMKALWSSIMQTQILMSRQLANPVPELLLIVVLSWSALLFYGFGLLANFTPITVVAEALGAIAVASAMFLILEFSQPYSGVFRLKPTGIDLVLAALVTGDGRPG